MRKRGSPMLRVCILYAPDESGLKRLAESLLKAFDHKKFSLTVKTAAKATIADVTAAQAVIFGCRSQGGLAIHPDFAEFVRAFKGVNLSGRSAAIFMEKDTATYLEFASALKDTDIALFDEPFLISKNLNQAECEAWVKRFIIFIEEHDYEKRLWSGQGYPQGA